MEKKASRIIIVWMSLIIIIMCSLIKEMDSESQDFFKFGPNNNLFIFGLHINTYLKYNIIVMYCGINSLIRTTYHNVLIPWQTNSIQDITIEKSQDIRCFAYEITYVIIIYNWVDWYIYMNILLAQVDMLLIEIVCDMIMSGIITRYYLNYKILKTDETDEVLNPLSFPNNNDQMV